MAMYVFSDESGDFKKRPYLLLGMLITSEHERLESEITKRRQATGYADRELKYSTTDRLKVDFGRSVIDLFIETGGLDFRCIVKSKKEHTLDYYHGIKGVGISAEDMAYNYAYKELLSNNGLTAPFVLVLDKRDLARRNNLHDYLLGEIPALRDVQARSSEDVGLLQLADLLTGCVFGDCASATHPVKRSLIDYLKQRLGVTTLSAKNPYRHRTKFNIWNWKAPRKLKLAQSVPSASSALAPAQPAASVHPGPTSKSTP